MHMQRNVRARARLVARTGALAIMLLAVALSGGGMVGASSGPAFMDSHQSVESRVNDLLGRMTLAEKVGQMDQIEVTQVTDTNPACTSQGGFNLPNPACEQKV